METRAHYVTVGTFVLLVLLGAMGFVYWLYKAQDNAGSVPVDVIFKGSVAGLNVGAPVFFNGLRIGTVSAISFSDQADPVVVVRAMVNPTAPLRQDVHAELGFQGITGIANLSFTGGSSGSPSLFEEKGVPTIEANRSALEDLISNARQTLRKADDTMATVAALVRENAPAVSRTIQNVERFSSALASNSDGIRDFMTQATRVANVLQGVADDLGAILTQGNKLIAQVTPQDVKVIVGNVRKFSDNLGKSGEQIQAVVDQVRETANDLQAFTTNLNATLTDVRAIVQAVPSAEVGRIVGNIDSLTSRIAARGADIDAMISDARAAVASTRSFTNSLDGKGPDVDAILADTRQTMANLNVASQKLAPLLGNVDGMLKSGEGKGLIEEATLTLRSVRRAADTLNGQLPGIMSGIGRFTSTGLPDLTAAIGQLRLTLSTIQTAVQGLERNPNRIIFGGSSQPVFQPNRH